MEKSIQQLESILTSYTKQLSSLTEDQWVYKPNPVKWSRKEVLGHLIDSAQNNIRRFIVARYEETPNIAYAQDFWVAAAGYQNYITADLLALWELLNRHICMVLKNIPESEQEKLCNTGELRSIKWLAADYNKHMLHHLHQLLDIESVDYP